MAKQKAPLEVTLNGHKHTYFRRWDMFGMPVMTHNKKDAKPITEDEMKTVIAKLILINGKDNVQPPKKT